MTAKTEGGFFMQDPEPDADARTSEGIFVRTIGSPFLVRTGDLVLVSGRVTESRAAQSQLAVTIIATQLGSPGVVRASSGSALPAPVVIGTAGRRPPTEVIQDDGDPEGTAPFDPESDALDFYETLEGMLVEVRDAVVVGPTSRFGETVVLPDGGAWASVRTPRGGIVIRPGDFNPERLMLDDEVLKAQGRAMPATKVGDAFVGAVVGPLDYSFGNYKVQALGPLRLSEGALSPEVTRAPRDDELAVATFNVENLDARDPPEKFAALARVVVENLRAPDLLALEEIQDNNGATSDAVVDASETYRALIAAIRAAGGPSYDWRDVAPVAGQDGGEPGGNIRVGFLFRTDRGLSFVDRPGATPTSSVAVLAGTDGPRLSHSPGRIDPTNTAFSTSRKPLAGEFSFRGRRLFVIANHFIAKLGDDPLFGRNQPPELGSEAKRAEQARICHEFVRRILAIDRDADVIVLGDLNDFSFSPPLRALTGDVLHDLVATLPAGERYTYVFEGNSQDLDHIVVTRGLLGRAEYDIVHVNAEFPARSSDHDPQVVRLRYP